MTCKAICRARPCPAANPPVWTKHGIKFDSLLKRDVWCNPTTETVIQSAHTLTPKISLHARVEYLRRAEIKFYDFPPVPLFSLKEDVWSLLWTEVEASFTSRYFVLAVDCCPTHR